MNDKFKIVVRGAGDEVSAFKVKGNLVDLTTAIGTIICYIADSTDVPAIHLIDIIKEALQCARLQ